MRADGGDQTRRTFDDLSDFLPAWSPDGRELAFASFREDRGPRDNAEIYTMRPDGSQLANLTHNAAGDFAPDWQPLGEHDEDVHEHQRTSEDKDQRKR